MSIMRVDTIPTELNSGGRLKVGGIEQAGQGSFGEDLKQMVKGVDALQHRADRAMEKAAVEGPTNIHETMLQVEEANLSMRLMLKVRSKALDAYQRVMRMQV